MVERRTVIRDADGVRRTIVTDSLDPNAFTVVTEQETGEIHAGIARDREIMRHGVNKKVATLPTFIYDDLARRGIAHDPDAFKKWLNGPEARVWRVWQGEI